MSLAQLPGAGPDALQHLQRHQAGGCSDGQAGRDPALEAGHADHEELVEVAGEDREVTHPLEQRQAGVLGQLQDALVEPQPRELAIEEPVGVVRQRRDSFRMRLVWRVHVVRLVRSPFAAGRVGRVGDDLERHAQSLAPQGEPGSRPLGWSVVSVFEKVEAGALRLAINLPERARRALAGRPVVLDGQTLAVDTQLMLALQRATRAPDVPTLPIPEGRAETLHQTRLTGGRQPIGSVRDLEVAGLPARLYRQVEPTSALLVFFHGGGWTWGTWTPTTLRAASWPSGPASRCCRSTTASPPNTRFLLRTTMPWLPTAGWSTTQRRSGRTRCGLLSGVTRPAATWRPARRSRQAAAAGHSPSSC